MNVDNIRYIPEEILSSFKRLPIDSWDSVIIAAEFTDFNEEQEKELIEYLFQYIEKNVKTEGELNRTYLCSAIANCIASVPFEKGKGLEKFIPFLARCDLDIYVELEILKMIQRKLTAHIEDISLFPIELKMTIIEIFETYVKFRLIKKEAISAIITETTLCLVLLGCDIKDLELLVNLPEQFIWLREYIADALKGIIERWQEESVSHDEIKRVTKIAEFLNRKEGKI